MKGDPKALELLNANLGNKLISINQYFLHARMFKNWGFGELNEHEYKKSIVEMKDADKLIERILFLEGLPNLQKLGKLLIGETPEEMLSCDLTLQTNIRSDLVDGIATCESIGDYVSRDLLEDILESDEEHIDWIETQQHLISNVGLENYLQSMMDS
ncbi:bacterioferritin [Gammaproteobacteria bacterium 45_16_T64]|nr:bacterioferritin [Gammaproteobacteria bacterium 45_16_T64]